MLVDNKLCECKDRIQAMAEHLKNVRQELTQTQVRVLVAQYVLIQHGWYWNFVVGVLYEMCLRVND